MVDRYTKAVLTVIALTLAGLIKQAWHGYERGFERGFESGYLRGSVAAGGGRGDGGTH